MEIRLRFSAWPKYQDQIINFILDPEFVFFVDQENKYNTLLSNLCKTSMDLTHEPVSRGYVLKREQLPSEINVTDNNCIPVMKYKKYTDEGYTEDCLFMPDRIIVTFETSKDVKTFLERMNITPIVSFKMLNACVIPTGEKGTIKFVQELIQCPYEVKLIDPYAVS